MTQTFMPFRWLYICVAGAILSGCAGSPLHVANAPGSREIQIGNESAYVVQENGLWLATYKDYFAKQLYNSPAGMLQRKMGLIRAIEVASGCKVAESTQDPGGLTVQAIVRCDSRREVTQSNAESARPPTPIASTASGQDQYQAQEFAKTQMCAADPRAVLIAKGAGFETYSIPCSGGNVLLTRCEFGNCRILK